MRIAGPNRVETPAVRRRERTDGSGQSFHLEQAETAHPAATASGHIGITAVESLLTLQELPDATTGRGRALKRADSILDALDDLRLGLLSGGIPQGTLKRIAALVRGRRDEFEDPKLTEILDEIDLRAQVELAKLEAAD